MKAISGPAGGFVYAGERGTVTLSSAGVRGWALVGKKLRCRAIPLRRKLVDELGPGKLMLGDALFGRH